MGDVVGFGMFGADGGHAGVGGFAGFGERIVAGVEVFTFFEFVLEEVFLVGEFAVEAEEALFVGGEGLRFVSGSLGGRGG